MEGEGEGRSLRDGLVATPYMASSHCLMYQEDHKTSDKTQAALPHFACMTCVGGYIHARPPGGRGRATPQHGSRVPPLEPSHMFVDNSFGFCV